LAIGRSVLAKITVLPDRDRFSIEETRITATWLHHRTWASGDGEPRIAVAVFTMKLEGGKLLWTPKALVSAHALARYFEKSGHRDHAVVLRNLGTLADAPGKGDEVETADGCSVGSVMRIRGKQGTTLARNVRTWR
jgi:hypothetical protein